MKTKITLSALLALVPWLMQAQNYTFSRVAPCPVPTYSPATFTIGNDIYVVGGVIGQQQTAPKNLTINVWDYNTVSNTWTRKNNFPGEPDYGASAFAINGLGYVVNGWDSTESGNIPNTLWQYDPGSDSWTTKSPYPGVARYTCGVFTLNNVAYMVAGFKPYENDMWAYDPSSDTWTQKASLPGAFRQAPIAFTAGNYGYAGMGATGDNLGGFYLNSDWYKYDPTVDAWTTLSNFPGAPVANSYTVTLNNEVYLIGGGNQNALDYQFGENNQVWEYDAPSDTWSLWGLFPDSSTLAGAWSTVGGVGYFGLGAFNSYTYPITPDFWKFGPATGPYSCNATIVSLFVNNATRDFQASGNFSPAARISWNFGDGSTGTGTSVIHSYTTTGTYIVTLSINDTTGTGCSSTQGDSVFINSISSCSVSVSSTSIDSDFTLIANSTGVPPYTYVWTSDSVTVSTSPDPLEVLIPGVYYNYCVTITDSTGCSASSCSNFYNQDTVGIPPVGCQTYLYIFPDSNGVPGTYDAYVYHIGAAPASYLWDFGDGTTSTLPEPQHTYASAGFYTVCLTVTDIDSCVSNYCDSFFYARSIGGGPMLVLNVLGSNTTGVVNVSGQKPVSVYPNPANDILHISANGYPVGKVAVYSTDGRQVAGFEAPPANQVYVGGLATGIYFIEINTGENTTKFKFVKTN